jgi:flagellar assembly protein FliH
MMARPLVLETFDTVNPYRPVTPEAMALLAEEQRLAAFEEGYRAGWDDATTAEDQEAGRISSELSHTLKDLSFTFHEARTHVLLAIGPLVRDIVAKILPPIAAQSLPQMVLDRVQGDLQLAAESPMQLTAGPATLEALQKVMPADPGFPLTLVAEPTLAPGQVYLRSSRGEVEINLDAATADLATIVDDFFSLTDERQVANG